MPKHTSKGVAKAAASKCSPKKATAHTSKGAAKAAAPKADILWAKEDEELLWGVTEAGIDELTDEVAENISLQAMSRMCRKGMGFRRSDDPRLKDAEYLINPDQEVGKILAVLQIIEEEEPRLRPASLWCVQVALAKAWHRWRETKLKTAHNLAGTSGCLGEPWFGKYEQPELADALASLWLSTLTALWDAGYELAPPPALLHELVLMPQFMARAQNLGEEFAAHKAHLAAAVAAAKAEASTPPRQRAESAEDSESDEYGSEDDWYDSEDEYEDDEDDEDGYWMGR
jgi:hypothetical protein